jgi:hypothetical protein
MEEQAAPVVPPWIGGGHFYFSVCTFWFPVPFCFFRKTRGDSGSKGWQG